jgi:hypothetical protein
VLLISHLYFPTEGQIERKVYKWYNMLLVFFLV